MFTRGQISHIFSYLSPKKNFRRLTSKIPAEQLFVGRRMAISGGAVIVCGGASLTAYSKPFMATMKLMPEIMAKEILENNGTQSSAIAKVYSSSLSTFADYPVSVAVGATFSAICTFALIYSAAGGAYHFNNWRKNRRQANTP